MKQFRKMSMIFVFVLSVILTGCQNNQQPSVPSEDFDAFVEKDFIDSMEDSYMLAHMRMEHPENYGVDMSKVKVTLGDVEVTDKERQEFLETKKEFEQFDRESLSASQQDVYDFMQYIIDYNDELIKDDYRYFNQCFSTIYGIQNDIPDTFTNITLRNEQDVKDVIILMEDVSPYVDKALDYTKKQAKAGYLMIDFDSVEKECKKIVDLGTKSSVLKVVNQHIEELKLSKEKTESYKKQLKEAFEKSYLPAFKKILSELKTLKSSQNNELGLAHLKNGKKYYELLFKARLGTNRSVEDMKKLLEEYAQDAMTSFQMAYYQNPDSYAKIQSASTGYKDYESMLVDLKEDIKDHFPELGDIDYTIQNLDEDLTNSSISAYFLIPPIDSNEPRQMFVNSSSVNKDIGSIHTFTTVAHEGIPGHMYHNYQTIQNIETPWLKTQSVLGFGEGYATYVEQLSLDYLKGKIDSNVLELYKYNEMYSNCIVALVDIGIHYEGWSKEETMQYLTEKGFSSSMALYNQIQNNPCAFIPYYAGYVEVMELRKKAEKGLGSQFKEKEFHQALLGSGIVPFSIAERHIDEYISKNK